MTKNLDERVNEIHMLITSQFDMVNHLLHANHEISRKVEEIANLRLENNQLKK